MSHVSTRADVRQDNGIVAVYSIVFNMASSLCLDKSTVQRLGSRDNHDRNAIPWQQHENQQSNQKSFTGTGQTNINNACELNYCSTWLVLNQFPPWKLTQSSGPAGKKYALTAVLSPRSRTQKKNASHSRSTCHFTVCPKCVFLALTPAPQSAVFTQELEEGTSMGGLSLINLFHRLINCVNGKNMKKQSIMKYWFPNHAADWFFFPSSQ